MPVSRRFRKTFPRLSNELRAKRAEALAPVAHNENGTPLTRVRRNVRKCPLLSAFARFCVTARQNRGIPAGHPATARAM